MVEDAVLDKVWPDDHEAEQAQDKFEQVRAFIQDRFGRDSALMGSLAKRTFLTGDKDLDIFVFFPSDVERDALEDEGLEIGEAVFEEFDGSYEVEYAEHPYTKGELPPGFEVEIVPAYRIESADQLRSSVDRTPLHTGWVNDALDDEKKCEVVLLKAFLKGQELYGSTLRVEGFSGYLCELLVAEYGSFRATLEAAVDWDEDVVIDPADHHEDGLPDELREKFEDESLVMIDPTDPERNVASVLSHDNHARFIYAAWRYLDDPGEEFFFPQDPEPDADRVREELEARGGAVVVSLPRPDVVDDLLYPQLRKLLKRVETALDEGDFRTFETGFHVDEDEVRLVLDLVSHELPAREKHTGPPVFHNNVHIQEFTERYDNVYVSDGRLVTLVDREHLTATALLEEFFASDPETVGVPPDLRPVADEAAVHPPELEGEDWLAFLQRFLRIGR